MPTAHVNLTDDESEALASLGRATGRSPQELLHDAVERILELHRRESRLAALRGGCGIWKNRDDLPDPERLRAEWDRI